MLNRRRFLSSTLGAAAGLMAPAVFAAPEKRKPNIVLIVIDDMGYTDVGCYGSQFFETPNVDRLAAEGMKFTDGYAACPVCSPTRASIMTGKYPVRLQLTNFLIGRRTRLDSPILPAEYIHQLPLEEVTLAEALKTAGYATCHVGKWHLGGEEYKPEAQGFDVNIAGAHHGAPRSFFWPNWGKNPPLQGKQEGEYLTDRLTDEAVQFIEQHQEQPFFLYFAHYAVHIPLEAKEEMIEKYKNREKPEQGQNNPIYAAMVESVDQSVGQVMDTLKRLGLEENTLVIFTSDNGGLSVEEGANTPATSNAPLREGKGYLYEGGIRVPFIFKLPGVIESGSVSSVPICSIDLFPTILELAGVGEVQTNGEIDGISILPVLQGKGEIEREALYWHYPHFSNQGGRPGGAIRQGEYKLIERYEDGTLQLYNLVDDISETENLAHELPEKTRELADKLIAWRERVKANMPVVNPLMVEQ
jgi:arylsulfatase A